MNKNNSVYAVALRPAKFSDVIGQDDIISSLKSQMESGRIPKAFILAGDPGGGKTTLARILAVSLQQEDGEDSGEPSEELLANYNNLDIHEFNASKDNKVDDMADLIEKSQFHPRIGSRRKVFILDEAHRITTQAQQMLLKPTEDAPGSTVWIFCTSEPGKIAKALQRRCVVHTVQELNKTGIKDLLARANKLKRVKNMRAFYKAAVLAEGVAKTPGIILQALEAFVNAPDSDPVKHFFPSDTKFDAFVIAKAVAAGNWGPIKKELMKQDGGKLSIDQAKFVRVVVMGWCRGALVKGYGDSAANYDAIKLLGDTDAGFDTSLLSSTVTAALFGATMGFK